MQGTQNRKSRNAGTLIIHIFNQIYGVFYRLIAYMVLSIISAILALPLLLFSGIGFGQSRESYGREQNSLSMLLFGIQLLIGLLQAVVALTTAAFSCRAVCCGCGRKPGSVNSTSGTTPADQTFTTSNQIVPSVQPVPTATSADLEEDSATTFLPLNSEELTNDQYTCL